MKTPMTTEIVVATFFLDFGGRVGGAMYSHPFAVGEVSPTEGQLLVGYLNENQQTVHDFGRQFLQVINVVHRLGRTVQLLSVIARSNKEQRRLIDEEVSFILPAPGWTLLRKHICTENCKKSLELAELDECPKLAAASRLIEGEPL